MRATVLVRIRELLQLSGSPPNPPEMPAHILTGHTKRIADPALAP